MNDEHMTKTDWIKGGLNILLKLIVLIVFIGIVIPVFMLDRSKNYILDFIDCIVYGINKLTDFDKVAERWKNRKNNTKNKARKNLLLEIEKVRKGGL